MKSLNIGVDSWIIQDGNYGDFSVGQKTEFAFEFYPVSLATSDCNAVSLTEISLNKYKICAQVVYSSEKVWVLDFGFMAYQESEPPKFAVEGSWVQGEIMLGIDPFFYFEYLNKIPDIPLLTYQIGIEQILLEMTPWMEIPNRNMIVRDKEKESFREVQKTDAWSDDNGHASYVLKCVADKN